MIYSEPLINQVRIFLLSVGVGVPLCLLYVAVQSIFHFFGRKKWAIYTADIIFCALGSFFSFFFMVFYNSGRVRLHLILGEAFGFFVFYRCLGKTLLSAGRKLAELLRRCTDFVLYPFIRVGKAFRGIFNVLPQQARSLKRLIKERTNKKEKPTEQGDKKMTKVAKKFNFIGKIHLKNPDKSV